MTTPSTLQAETLKEVSDRELQEKILTVLTKQEKHQKYISNIILRYIIFQIVAVFLVWVVYNMVVNS